MKLPLTLSKMFTAATAAACIIGQSADLKAAAFTPGNIVVYRIGDGTSGLVNTGAAIYLDEFNAAGTLVQSVAIPSTGSNAVVASGTATSEGILSRSGDGQFLTVTGYNRAIGGSGSLSGTASATVNRAVVLVQAAGTILSTTKLSDFADGNNPRSAVTNNGAQFWVTGGAGGVRYVSSAAATTSTQVSTTLANTRQLLIAGGQLYTSTSSGSAIRIGAVGTGLPTTSSQTITNLAGIPANTGSPNGFFFADLDATVAGVDTLYIADDTDTVGTGGIRKFSLVSGSWVANGIAGSSGDAYRGVTGSVSGGTVTLYATRKGGGAAAGGGELVSIVDGTGYNAAITAAPTLLSTAATNTAYRGVAMAPEVPKVILTEVNSNASTGGDFWELTNVGTTPVDLSNWKWDDDSQNPLDAAAVTVPVGTTIAAGESIIFTVSANAATFRSAWGSLPGVQIITGGPGLGGGDGIALFNAANAPVFFFSYGVGGFTRSNGSGALGGHAGASAGGADAQSAVIDPTFGYGSTRRYTAATAGTFGAYASTAGGSNIGSPGVTGLNFGAAVTLSLSITPSTFSEGSANPAAVGTVTRGTSGTSDLVVSLSSSDTTEATVPATVTILANQTSANFNVTAVNDALADGSQTVTITATATNANSPTFNLTVQDDEGVATPTLATQPASTTIATGYTATLSLSATSTVPVTIQWYQGAVGTTATPVGTNSNSFTTPVLTATTSYWARVTNSTGSVDTTAATVTVTSGVTSVNLANYVRVGRYNLPEYRRTALPAGTPVSNLLCDEASGVAYNWDTDTLFICGDGGRAITQVTKTGQLVDTMTLALNVNNPQGTEFYDPEGITYVGNGQFVFTEERERRIVKFTYIAGSTLTRAAAQTVDLGTYDDNTGTEGLSYDPQTGGFIVLKEKNPIGVFQTNVDFAAGTATNGSPTTVNSTNLFDTTKLGMSDVADVFAFSNIPSMVGQPQAGNMLILGQEDARVVNVDRNGNIFSTLNITSDAGNPLSAGDQQHEGITMDRAGLIYIVNENGGGSTEYPQLWVYASTTQANTAPTAVAVNNSVTALQENTSTASPVKMGDIVVTDDGLGTNTLSLSGTDAAFFELSGTALYLKAGTVLDYETKTSYTVTVNVDDTTVGTTPDAFVSFTLTVIDQVVETPAAPAVIITEVAPWSSGNSPVGGDWFEVTNVSANAVNVTGWKVDDDSGAFASAIALNGITSIAPGESVIFIEASTANQATIVNTFKNNWFGANVPAGLQIGTYTGSSIGLSTGGDQVNLFNAGGVLQAKVIFGATGTTIPYATLDNTVALNATTISTFSAVGVNGAFVAANSSVEIGSPGYAAPGVLRITEVAPWASGNSPAAADWFEVTNIGARAVDMTGWKVDDSSETAAGAFALTGISSIAPGESVIYMETATLAATRATFLNTWFGANPPAALQVGSYSGSELGLSTNGDAVNLFDSNNVRRANVAFGVSSSTAPYASFDNAAGVNVGTISQKSAVGVNGAFVAATDANEIGSPGISTISGPLSFAAWLTLNGYTGTAGGDSDNDGLPDALEYFFNTNPNNPKDQSNLPQVVPNGSDLEFRFTYLTNSVQSGFLRCSEDLVNWVDAVPGLDYEVISQTVNGNQTTVRYRLFRSMIPSAQGPFSYIAPFTASVEGGSLNGVTINNHGLVGAGRLSGNLLDSFGETMGAASGLSITNWGYNSVSGQFTGTFNVLPDRGYNSGTIFSNYAARVHEVPFTFTPYFGAGPVAQGQIVPSYSSTTKFTYLDGATTKFTTGLNPTGTRTVFGQTVGTVAAANGPGGATEQLLSFDAEAIHVFPDGSGFVSDEYGTYLVRFNSAKQFTRIIQLPVAGQPHSPVGILNFDAVAAPLNGRRNNQGLEGMSVSPDNTRLFALMQSAMVQDASGGSQNRYNTRLFVYDIAGANLENPVLIAEHVVQLPRYDLNGNSSGVDNTSAQSEIVAISNTQFLMLPRDGNGLGKGTTDPIVMRTVDLVDFSAASNILGLYDGEANQVSPGGVLRSTIVPASSTVVVNLVSSTDLAKFGINTNTSNPNQFTLNEKIEGMALVPDLSTPSPEDFFLFVANDNDFQSSDVRMLDATGAIVSYGDARDRGITNDANYWVYRITISPNARKFYRISVDTP